MMRLGGDRRKEGRSGLSEALASRQGGVVHLTHNDLDAIGADAIHRLRFGEIFTVYSSVGRFKSNLEKISTVPGNGELLSISDLGFQDGALKLLEKIRSQGWRVEWRDHHRWREEEISAVDRLVDFLHVDTSTCATGIVARDLLPGDVQALEIAAVVCDYDLWKHEDPRSAILGQVTNRFEHRELVRDAFVRGEVLNPAIEEIYFEIKCEMDRNIEKSVSHADIHEGRYRIACAPLYGYPSETAAAIRERMKTDIEVIVGSNGRFSIRSVPPVSHLVARKFGGGGHPNAAGGTFAFTLLDRIVFSLLKKNRHFGQLVQVAESITE